ncbi:glycosyltransferase [Plantibacter flavus]|uniref:glycosyltransferase n=1 Tax=Plantibacter flavus TaxID=150123 RepID=UPI001375E2EB|nr:glycosyltransferase [Plantibacter flavus]
MSDEQVGRVDVLFLIVNYHSADAVAGLLESIAAKRGASKVGISVVDNSESEVEHASLSAIADRYRSDFDLVLCTRSAANLGYAGGNNRAYEAAEQIGLAANVIVVANPDVKIADGLVSVLADEVDHDPQALFAVTTRTNGSLSSGLYEMDTRWGQTKSVWSHGAAAHRSFLYPGGHFIVTSNALWQNARGFSDDFFLFCEEADLVLRLQESNGFSGVRAIESVVVDHDQGLTTGAHGSLKEKSLTTYFHGTRSRVVLFRKHAALRKSLPLVVMLRAAWAVLVLLKAGTHASRAVFQGMQSGFAWRRVAVPGRDGRQQ